METVPPLHRSRRLLGLLPPVFDNGADLRDLPRDIEPWHTAAPHSGTREKGHDAMLRSCLHRARAQGWNWPRQPILFISDTHADAEGFLRSLVAGGAIRRDAGRGSFELTEFGRDVRIIIGGDCLDKGPSNLDMLDALAALKASGANLTILAGNHDLRLRLAVDAQLGPRDALNEHLFVRMGRKILPLLAEVLDRFVSPTELAAQPDEARCRALLHPRADWSERFPAAAKQLLAPQVVAREIAKMSSKQRQFDQEVAQSGLSYRALRAALLKSQEVFFTPGGYYAWFYEEMDVLAHEGSLLFVHAGLCDRMCAVLTEQGPQAVNRAYRAEVAAHPFACYFGPLANLVRTKYRSSDFALTAAGVARLHAAGIHMVVQGHVNNHAGQRLLAKRGLLHLEGDVTLDRASRAREGLEGIGAGATLIFPTGDVIGLSRDYPRAKHFAPERMA